MMEPATNGKVVLRTSAGDIDIELWPKETPLACRNFVQLCMENYYDATIFHRLVPGFIIQGGDPTGTGMGGDSIYGKPFKDEIHSRLRFVRRGLVAMANGGKDDNASQFFITLGPTNDLNKKHTIFGKITGDTIYNLVKMAEGECDHNEKPVNPNYIKTTHVLNNPFDDIVPRNLEEQNEKKIQEEISKKPKKKKSKAKAHKKLTVLSFGDEAAEDEELAEKVNKEIKAKSAHDAVKEDASIIKEEFKPEEKTEEDEKWVSKRVDGEVNLDDVDDLASWMRTKMEERNKQIEREDKEKIEADMNERKRKVMSYQDQQKVLMKELNELRKKENTRIEEVAAKKSKKETRLDNNSLFGEFKAEQELYKEKTAGNKFTKADYNSGKVVRKNREADTMAMLKGFRSTLFDAKEIEVTKSRDWLKHTLQRETTMRDEKLNIQDLEAKDMNRDIDSSRYDISDPRNPLNMRRRGAK